MMMGGGKHGSDLNELVGINVAIKNDILEKLGIVFLEEPSLLRYVAHNSITVIHNLISLCRHETKNIFEENVWCITVFESYLAIPVHHAKTHCRFSHLNMKRRMIN